MPANDTILIILSSIGETVAIFLGLIKLYDLLKKKYEEGIRKHINELLDPIYHRLDKIEAQLKQKNETISTIMIELQDIKNRLTILEQTTINEKYIRQIIEQEIQPIRERIKKIEENLNK